MQSLSKSHKHANPDKARDPVLGDILVVVAQIAAALQFIIEEKYLAKYRVPALLGVGLEGMWGLLLSAIALPILSVVKGSDGLATDSLFSAFREISHSWQLQVGPECQLHFFTVVGQSLPRELPYLLEIILQNQFNSALRDAIYSEQDQNLTVKHRKREITYTRYVVHTP